MARFRVDNREENYKNSKKFKQNEYYCRECGLPYNKNEMHDHNTCKDCHKNAKELSMWD